MVLILVAVIDVVVSIKEGPRNSIFINTKTCFNTELVGLLCSSTHVWDHDFMAVVVTE